MKKLLALLLCAGLASSAAGSSKKSSAARERTDRAQASAAPAENTYVATGAALPSGTALKMKLETRISTRYNKAGDRFTGWVTEPVTWQGQTVIPVNARIEGQVARVSEHRRIRGTPVIDLRPESVTMPNGDRYALSAVVVDTDARPDVDVDDEGRLRGRGHDGRDWKETGIAGGGGALAGGLIAGPEGMLIGAGVGATGSVIHWLAKTRSAELPAGTEITFELSRPMVLSNTVAGNSAGQ